MENIWHLIDRMTGRVRLDCQEFQYWAIMSGEGADRGLVWQRECKTWTVILLSSLTLVVHPNLFVANGPIPSPHDGHHDISTIDSDKPPRQNVLLMQVNLL